MWSVLEDMADDAGELRMKAKSGTLSQEDVLRYVNRRELEVSCSRD